MAELFLKILEKDYTERADNPALVYQVQSITRAAEGQDKEAVIKVSGPELDLWELTNLIANPARIYQLGSVIFRGLIRSVIVKAATGLTVSISYDAMYNKIKVIYSNIAPGEENAGEPAETSWYSNTDSIGFYGTRQKIINLSDANSEQAIAYANRAIYDYAWPAAQKDLGSLGNQQDPEATITLAGWFDTLDWMIYTQDAGKEEYEDSAGTQQSFGDVAGTTKLAQSFQLGSAMAWTASSVKIRIKKEGSPTDNLTVEVCADNSGAPGTVLASATISGVLPLISLDWLELTLSVKVNLALSTTYWLVVRRSGANDGTNYYKTDVNEALGYTRGALKIWNGSAWVARSPDADLLFSILGVTETTTQISQIITACGQFLTATVLDSVSGVYSSPYRDGTQTGLAVIKELFKSGTTNYRRLQASIDDERRLIISEEKALGSENYKIDAAGTLYDPYMNRIEKATMPAGVWLELVDIVPAQAQFIGVRNPTTVFVESVTWQMGGKMRWKFRGYGALLSWTGVD